LDGAYGPFHRTSSPTQTFADALRQKEFGEIWGRAGRIGGLVPAVKAYVGPICYGEPPGVPCEAVSGVQFVTDVPPSEVPPGGMAFVRWFAMPGEQHAGFRVVDAETVAIQVILTKIHYGPGKDWRDGT
jgi:hypothetical protein